MKKILISLFMTIVFALSASAQGQSCTITGDNNSSIMVTSASLDGSTVIVNVENDCNTTAANVTVTVKVNYRGNQGSQTFNGYGRCEANQSTSIKVNISTKKNTWDMADFEVVSISGKKCTI